MSPNCITFRRFIVATAFVGAQYAAAQDIRDGLIHNTRGISAVPVRSEPKESIGTFTGMSNQIFKPQGPGPFPAVVLVHTCGGIDQAGHMRTHGQEMLSAGYVVFMLDSFGPRGIRNCRSPVTPSSFGALDAYAALEYLDSLPFVEKKRIFQAGYSWGGVVASFLASPQSSEVWKSKLRFRATVANYSPCSV